MMHFYIEQSRGGRTGGAKRAFAPSPLHFREIAITRVRLRGEAGGRYATEVQMDVKFEIVM